MKIEGIQGLISIQSDYTQYETNNIWLDELLKFFFEILSLFSPSSFHLQRGINIELFCISVITSQYSYYIYVFIECLYLILAGFCPNTCLSFHYLLSKR